MGVSLGRAAKLAGVGKTTLTRAIHGGRVSATRRENGSYEIEISELARAYNIRVETAETPDAIPETVALVHHATPAETPTRHPETLETVAKMAALEAQVQGLKALLDEVKQARDDWKSQAERLALTGPSERKGFWRRLVG